MHVLDVKGCFYSALKGMNRAGVLYGSRLQKIQTHWTLLVSFSALGNWCQILFGTLKELQ